MATFGSVEELGGGSGRDSVPCGAGQIFGSAEGAQSYGPEPRKKFCTRSRSVARGRSATPSTRSSQPIFSPTA